MTVSNSNKDIIDPMEVLEQLSQLFNFELTERIDLFGVIPIYKSKKIWKRVPKNGEAIDI